MNHILKWLYLLTLASFTKQECLYSTEKFICEKVPMPDIIYEFYSKADFIENVTSIEIIGANYSKIEYFLYPLQEKIEDNIINIRISQCDVETVSDDAFTDFTNLQVLDLSNNKIEDISFVKYLPNKLKKLCLNGNYIVNVGNVFSNLKHLQYVDISSCKIEKNFDMLVFKDVMELDLVNVSNNKINTLISSSLVENVHFVDASYNILETFQNIPIESHDVSFTLYSKIKITINFVNNSLFLHKIVERGNKDVGIEAHTSNNSSVSVEVGYFDISYAKYNIKQLRNLLNVKIINEFILKNSVIPALNKSIYNLANLFSKESNEAKLDLSNCSVAEIDEFYFENYILGTLNLSGNIIKKIKSNTFRNAQFKVLDLSWSKIEIIESLAFDGLSCGSLNLSRNELSAVLLKNVKSIKEIDLSYNKLISINSGSFGSLKNVQLLDLSHNLLTSIDNTSLSNFERITVLNLNNNKLNNIEGLFLYTLKINSLFISYNDDLSPNALKNENNYLKSLTIKDFETRELNKNYFLGLKNLEKLFFENSEVLALAGGSLNGLFSLQFLDSQNLFKHITVLKKHIFTDLKRLIELNLSSLSIEVIQDETFIGLKSLNKLDLTSNKIYDISSKTFAGLDNLHSLYFGNNKLAAIPLGVFMNLPSLKTLNMSHNLLNQLETGVFSNLRNLTYLDLSYNALDTINPEILFPLKNLFELYLDGNQLITLDYKNIFYFGLPLSVVGLSGNKWNCGFLYSMLKNFEFRRITYQPLQMATFTDKNINGISCTDECNSDIYCVTPVASQ